MIITTTHGKPSESGALCVNMRALSYSWDRRAAWSLWSAFYMHVSWIILHAQSIMYNPLYIFMDTQNIVYIDMLIYKSPSKRMFLSLDMSSERPFLRQSLALYKWAKVCICSQMYNLQYDFHSIHHAYPLKSERPHFWENNKIHTYIYMYVCMRIVSSCMNFAPDASGIHDFTFDLTFYMCNCQLDYWMMHACSWWVE